MYFFYVGSPDRARMTHLGQTFREMAIAETEYRESQGAPLITKEYWGPWTQEMHDSLDAAVEGKMPSFNRVVDPYNQDEADGGIRGGFVVNVDRGRATITGASPYYYSDGESLRIWVSKGPDGDTDIGLPDLQNLAAKEWNSDRSLDYGKWLPTMAPFLYDPTNGTTSGGDIFRWDVFE